MHFRRSFVRLGAGKQGKKQSNRHGMRDVAIEATFHQGNEEDEVDDVDHPLLSGLLCTDQCLVDYQSIRIRAQRLNAVSDEDKLTKILYN